MLGGDHVPRHSMDVRRGCPSRAGSRSGLRAAVSFDQRSCHRQHGEPITGLAPADFTVEVDGRPVQISDVAHADDPAQVAVVFNFKQPDGIGALAAAVLGGNPRSSVAVARTFANDGNAGWGRLPDLPPFSSDLKVIEAGLAAQRDRERGNSDARVPPSPVGLLTDVCRALAAIHATRPNIVFFLDQAHDPGGLMSVSLSEPVRSGPDAADDLQRTLSSSFAAIWTIATPRQPISEKASEIAPEFAPFSESYRFMSTISPASGGAVL